MKAGTRVEVTARTLDDDGLGAGPCGRLEVCAPDWLPGEHARVEIEHVSQHRPRAWGRVLERVGPDARVRVAPVCPAFGQCGGCVWQHLGYEAQLEHKRERVAGALAGAGVLATVEPVVPAPTTEAYRNVGKYVAARADRGLVLGGYAPRTHRVVDMAGCRVVEPIIDRVRGAACEALVDLPVYDEAAREGVLRYVVVRSGADGRALVGVVTTSQADRAALGRAADALAAQPDIAGVVWVRNDTRGGAILTADVTPLAGRPYAVEIVAGVDIELGIADFFQVNRAQASRMYEAVAGLAAGAGRIVDVYTGAGGISFAMARNAGVQCILGIERNDSAVRAAGRAAGQAGLGRVRFVAGDAAGLPEVAGRELGGRAELIVVNPPRKGLDRDTLRALEVMAPPRLVYVSCGPESLARDLAELRAYRVERALPFDLMPGTPQVETVVALAREA